MVTRVIARFRCTETAVEPAKEWNGIGFVPPLNTSAIFRNYETPYRILIFQRRTTTSPNLLPFSDFLVPPLK